MRFDLADDLPRRLTPHRATYDALVAPGCSFISPRRLGRSLEELRDQPPEGDDDEAPSLF